MNKNELLVQLEKSREEFLEAIDGLSEEEMQAPGVTGAWSIKDILIHLARWEAELIKLLWQARQGLRPTSAHFSGEDVDTINARWYSESQDRSLQSALEDFHGVRNQTIRRAEEITEKELNDAHRLAWLKSRPLWEWIESDSFGHEAEHAAEIIAWRAARAFQGEES